MIPLFTDSRLACWQRMQSEKHPYWATILKAANDATGKAVWDNLGICAAILYQITGDATYAANAYQQITTGFVPPQNANTVRARFAFEVLTWYAVWNGLTPAQQTTALGRIQTYCNYALAIGQPVNVGGFRPGDTDQTIGQYSGLALAEHLFPQLGTWLDKTSNLSAGNAMVVGGLDATAADRTTVRNDIAYFVSLAAGGEWPVSSEYNVGDDTVLVMTMWLSLKQILGVDHFPEVAAWIPRWALALIHDVTPGLTGRVEWGDEENPGDIQAIHRYDSLACCQLCLQEIGDTTTASWIAFHLQELTAKYGMAVADPDFPIFFDPYATQADYRPSIPRTLVSSGLGYVTRRDDWGPNGTLFHGFSPNVLPIDHACTLVGDFRVFAGKEWVIRHPIGYNAEDALGDASNSILLCGLSTMAARGMQLVEDADDYLHCDCYTSGPRYAPGYWQPPPPFVSECMRSVIYLPKLSAVVVCDRLNLQDPRMLPLFNRYQTPDQKAMTGAAHLKQILWHSPGTPTISANSATWTTAGGQAVRLDSFSPQGPLAWEVDNEATLWTSGWKAGQLGYRLRVGSDRTWDSIVSVIQWGSPQVPVAINQGSMCGWQLGSTAVVCSSDPTTRDLPGPAATTVYSVGSSGIRVTT